MLSNLQNNLKDIYDEIMNNLIPENIKNGVTILGVTGTYEGPESEEPNEDMEVE